MEYTCDEKENRRREQDGRFAMGFSCTQLVSWKFIYKDVNDDDIKKKVKFNAGCELRCTNNCVALWGQ